MWLLEEETRNYNPKGGAIETYISLFKQLPFFSCYNVFISEECQKYIEMYTFCKETGTPPYSGDYGNQPKIWKEYYFIINSATAARKKIANEESDKNQKQKKVK